MTDFFELREGMVANQVAARGVRSEKVLDAMRKVPREQFLPEGVREFAYEDSPLPIEAGQTISQPYIVAFMIEGLALRGGEKVLEIGAAFPRYLESVSYLRLGNIEDIAGNRNEAKALYRKAAKAAGNHEQIRGAANYFLRKPYAR